MQECLELPLVASGIKQIRILLRQTVIKKGRGENNIRFAYSKQGLLTANCVRNLIFSAFLHKLTATRLSGLWETCLDTCRMLTYLKRRGMSRSFGYTDSQAEIFVLMPFREENVPACFVHSFGITVSGN